MPTPVETRAPAPALAPVVAPAPPAPASTPAVAPAPAPATSAAGGGAAPRPPGTVAGRAAAAMVARAQPAAVARRRQGGRKRRRVGGIRQMRRMRSFQPRSRRRLPGWGSWVRWKEEEGEEARSEGRGKRTAHPTSQQQSCSTKRRSRRSTCPISFGIIFAPVIAMDGHSYERAAIEEWIETRLQKGQPITSPFTNQPMARTLIPNLALRNLIRAYCEEHALPFPTGPAVYNMG